MSWVDDKSWRWRCLAHFPISFIAECVRPGEGLVIYGSHEVTQALAAKKWQMKNTLDMVPAVIAFVLRQIIKWL